VVGTEGSFRFLLVVWRCFLVVDEAPNQSRNSKVVETNQLRSLVGESNSDKAKVMTSSESMEVVDMVIVVGVVAVAAAEDHRCLVC